MKKPPKQNDLPCDCLTISVLQLVLPMFIFVHKPFKLGQVPVNQGQLSTDQWCPLLYNELVHYENKVILN